MQQQNDSSLIGSSGMGLFKPNVTEQKLEISLGAFQRSQEKFLEKYQDGITISHGDYSKHMPAEEIKKALADDEQDSFLIIYLESLLINLWKPQLQEHSGNLFELFQYAELLECSIGHYAMALEQKLYPDDLQLQSLIIRRKAHWTPEIESDQQEISLQITYKKMSEEQSKRFVEVLSTNFGDDFIKCRSEQKGYTFSFNLDLIFKHIFTKIDNLSTLVNINDIASDIEDSKKCDQGIMLTDNLLQLLDDEVFKHASRDAQAFSLYLIDLVLLYNTLKTEMRSFLTNNVTQANDYTSSSELNLAPSLM